MEKNYLVKENEKPKEFAERLQKQVDEYKETLSKVTSQEELAEEEKKCMDELDKYEDYLKKTEYELANGVDFDGTHYTKKDISAAIIYFVNKMEVKWDYTLGMYEISRLWRGDVQKLNFRELDSTLRTLDQVQFKGFKEWKDILAVNEFFKSNNEQFSFDTAGMIYLHQRHNAVMERQDLVKTVPSKPVEVEEPKPVEPVEEVKKFSKKKGDA